jgi:hypothetical protein
MGKHTLVVLALALAGIPARAQTATRLPVSSQQTKSKTWEVVGRVTRQ